MAFSIDPSRLAEVVGEDSPGLGYIIDGRRFIQTDGVPQGTCQAEDDITVRSDGFPRTSNSFPQGRSGLGAALLFRERFGETQSPLKQISLRNLKPVLFKKSSSYY